MLRMLSEVQQDGSKLDCDIIIKVPESISVLTGPGNGLPLERRGPEDLRSTKDLPLRRDGFQPPVPYFEFS